MNLIKEFREYLKSTDELKKMAQDEALDFFNIDLRNDKPCITFHNVIVNEAPDNIVSVLFELRDRYYNDRINKII